MPDLKDQPPELPPHIAETIKSITALHAEHHMKASIVERAVARVTARLASPRFIVILTVALAGWIGLNLTVIRLGHHTADPPPFSWLNIVLAIGSFYMVVLILATQRRDDELAQLREQVTLQLVLLAEQKLAKVIQLLEEARRDNPLMHDRVDGEAEAMARPADTESVIHSIKESHAEAEQIAGASDMAGNGIWSVLSSDEISAEIASVPPPATTKP